MSDRNWQDALSTPEEIEQKSSDSKDSKESKDSNTDTTVLVQPVVEETTKTEEVKRESINIKIHLNLHAKVKLDLDAQFDGDIIIGLS